MSQRFLAWMLAAILAAAGALPAAAETVDPEPLKPIEPPSSLPRAQRGDKTQNLDRLFAALKVAPDDESAKYIENRIWAIWLASSSDTANLLMGRAKSAADGKDFDLAIRLLTAVIDIRPDRIDIGPDGQPGFEMKTLILDELSWMSEGFGLEIEAGKGDLTLAGITARARIELNPPGHKQGRLKRLILRELKVARPTATGLTIKFADGSLKLDPTQQAILGPLTLEAPAGEPGFIIGHDKTGKLFTQGKLSLQGFNLPNVAADVAPAQTFGPGGSDAERMTGAIESIVNIPP